MAGNNRAGVEMVSCIESKDGLKIVFRPNGLPDKKYNYFIGWMLNFRNNDNKYHIKL